MSKARKPQMIAGFVVLMLVSASWLAAAIFDLAKELAGYPYTASDPASRSPYGFGHRSSMDYVAWTLNNTGITLYGRKFTNNWGGGSDLEGWGYPSNWPAFATKLGFTVDNHAAVGSIAHWTVRYAGDTDDRGHVAVVTRVNADNTIDVEEYDYQSASNNFTAHTFGARSGIGRTDNYIHLERSLPGGMWNVKTTPNGPIGGSVTVAVDAMDNSNGGLDFVQITVSLKNRDCPWLGWQTIKRGQFQGAQRGAISPHLHRPR